MLTIKLFVLKALLNRANKGLTTLLTRSTRRRTAVYQFVKENNMLSGEVKMIRVILKARERKAKTRGARDCFKSVR